MAMTKAQEDLLKAAKTAAIELKDNGRELTSLIGELSVCKIMGLVWEPSTGYDVKNGADTYQIKTRKSWTTEGVNRAGRLGRFGTKQGYCFTVGIHVELDRNFEVANFWKFNKAEPENLEDPNSARGLHVSTLVKHKKPEVW